MHICICICTYQRRIRLRRLLTKLDSQKTDGLFTYSALVVDNDDKFSARDVVERVRKNSAMAIEYLVEPERSIPLSRNRGVQNARGDMLAFIDDDEFPADDYWLLKMVRAYRKFNPAGVLGPVTAHFDEKPPKWIIKAGVLERKRFKTGHLLHWDETRTGNVLIRRDIFLDSKNLFDPKFTHGQDKDFFRRMTAKGHTFVWCDEAPVYETCRRDRFKLPFYLKRSVLRGNISLVHHAYDWRIVLKSLIALAIYTQGLPVLFVLDYSLFIKYLIKDLDHLGILSAACGFDSRKYIRHL